MYDTLILTLYSFTKKKKKKKKEGIPNFEKKNSFDFLFIKETLYMFALHRSSVLKIPSLTMCMHVLRFIITGSKKQERNRKRKGESDLTPPTLWWLKISQGKYTFNDILYRMFESILSDFFSFGSEKIILSFQLPICTIFTM